MVEAIQLNEVKHEHNSYKHLENDLLKPLQYAIKSFLTVCRSCEKQRQAASTIGENFGPIEKAISKYDSDTDPETIF
jgi:hypothetical protein